MDWKLECEELRHRILTCSVASGALRELLERYLYPYEVMSKASEDKFLISRHGMQNPMALVFIGDGPEILSSQKAKCYLLSPYGDSKKDGDSSFDRVFDLNKRGALVSFLQILISDLCLEHASDLICTDERMKKEILGIGVVGSVARRRAKPRSDLDLFVVVEKEEDGDQEKWYWRLREILDPMERDITVFVYPLSALEEIASWHVLRMASEGCLIYDREGRVSSVFLRIREAAGKAGLEEVEFEGDRIWTMSKSLKPGEVIEVTLR